MIDFLFENLLTNLLIYKKDYISFYEEIFMPGKPITLWVNDKEEKLLKKMAEQENRTVSNFIKTKCKIFKEKK